MQNDRPVFTVCLSGRYYIRRERHSETGEGMYVPVTVVFLHLHLWSCIWDINNVGVRCKLRPCLSSLRCRRRTVDSTMFAVD